MKRKVLVVGAGLGGLSAAIHLAASGFSVEIFEKNPQIGGKLNVLERDGFRFDLGPSIIILPQIFARLFERAGRRMEDAVELVEVQPQWRTFFEDGTVLDLYSDARRMEAELARLGADGDGYWAFVEYSRRLYRATDEAYLSPGADHLSEILRTDNVGRLLREADVHRTMASGIAHRVKEPHLRDLLAFFAKYVGSSPYDAPALMNLLPYAQLGWGLWYVRGGLYELARAIGRLLDELGVRVHLGAEVVRIERQGSRVTGLSLADGSTHRADVVVCNMEVVPAYERLLGESGGFTRRMRRRLEPAASGLVVHLGIDRAYPQLHHHNFFFSRDPKRHFDTIHHDKRLPDDPTIYAVCPTVTDPSLAPSGHHVLKLLPHLPHLQDEPFPAGAYEALEERLFDKLERMGLTDLRRHVVVRDVLTPEDIERLYYSNRGAIYGVVANRRNFTLKAPKRSERYENLYFVGGSVNPGGGTPMVVLCGEHVARLIREDTS